MTNGDYVIIEYTHTWQAFIEYTHIYVWEMNILPMMPMHQDLLLVRNREAANILIDSLFSLNLGFSSQYPLAAVCSI